MTDARKIAIKHLALGVPDGEIFECEGHRCYAKIAPRLRFKHLRRASKILFSPCEALHFVGLGGQD